MSAEPPTDLPYPVSHTVAREARVPVGELFDVIVAEDVLPKVLHRYGIIPAVVATEGLTGPWDTPGSQRRVVTSDGRSLREEVTAWEHSHHFAYRVDGFTGVMGSLVSQAVGTWSFSGSDSHARFTWTYTFSATSAATRPLVRLIVASMWAPYMRGCADRCVALAETGT
jgi:hypothetical protein